VFGTHSQLIFDDSFLCLSQTKLFFLFDYKFLISPVQLIREQRMVVLLVIKNVLLLHESMVRLQKKVLC